MNQYNAIVQLDPRHLGKPLATFEARQFSSFVARIVNAPDNIENLFVRVFKPADGGYYDIPASQNGNGDWTARVIGACFPSAGDGLYEIHATDAAGNPTALGRGKTRVYPFTANGGAVKPGQNVSVATLPDQSGALHQVVAVQVDGEWTWQVRAVQQ